jgi:hypothetical protein
MNSVNSIVSFTYIALGIYLAILIFRARYTGFVNNALLWDRTKKFEDCRDKEGFLHYLFPRGLVCAAALLISGVFGIVSENSGIPADYQMVSMIAMILVFFYYIYIIRNAMAKFY